MEEYGIRMLCLGALFLPGYVALRRPWRHRGPREWVLGAFVLYMLALLCLALEGDYRPIPQMVRAARLRLSTGEGINLQPLYTVRTFFRYMGGEDFLVNIVGNTVLFIPWGLGLGLLWEKNRRPGRLLSLCLALPVAIETVQLFIGRRVDADDVILNFLGGLLGAALWYLCQKKLPRLKALGR